ncbi:MAG: DUF6029 family protein [Bacteroidota bacterium]
MNKLLLILVVSALILTPAYPQDTGQISGSLESNTHGYLRDKLLGIPEPDNQLASNNYLLLQYNNGPFSGALQYEAYMPPLSGYPYQLEGNRLTHLNFRYHKEVIDITAGSFYEQFGNGLILRAYESRELGINNALNGVRVTVKPLKYLRITGIYGKPRSYAEISSSYIRGFDTELDLGQVIKKDIGLKLAWGLVSRYQAYFGPSFFYPTTVDAYSLRLSVNYKDLDLNTEYVHKGVDPSAVNLHSFENGGALLVNGSYTASGFGISASARFLKGMDFRSERETSGNYHTINYLPSNTWQHNFLLAGIYPCSTQTEGEASVQADINYSIPGETFMGGTKLRLGFSHVRSINVIDYPVLVSFGDEVFYQDLTVEMTRKWSSWLKTVASFTYLKYNKDVLEYPGAGFVQALIPYFEVQLRFNTRFSLKTELQHLRTKQDEGNWTAGLVEFAFAPHLSVFVSDLWNYGNPVEEVHYYNTGLSVSTDYFRVSAGYGRHREGLICAGGVCQMVPAYRGFNMNLSVNF